MGGVSGFANHAAPGTTFVGSRPGERPGVRRDPRVADGPRAPGEVTIRFRSVFGRPWSRFIVDDHSDGHLLSDADGVMRARDDDTDRPRPR